MGNSSSVDWVGLGALAVGLVALTSGLGVIPKSCATWQELR
jgi:hypothetical protein